MSNDDDSDDYKVGYGKPPLKTRFTKGRSGNPAGKRKRRETDREIVARVRDERIPITINGKKEMMSNREAIVRQTNNMVLKRGNVRELLMLLRFYADYGEVSREDAADESRKAAGSVIEKMLDIFDKTHADTSKEENQA